MVNREIQPVHWFALGTSLLVFGGLFLASRTVLPSQKKDSVSAPVANHSSISGLQPVQIPPDQEAFFQKLGEQLSNVQSVSPSEQKLIYENAVAAYSNIQRLDYAAKYQEELAKLNPGNLDVELKTARLFREAQSTLTDSAQIVFFNQSARHWYERVIQQSPKEETIQIEYALTLTESNEPGVMMQGIQKLVQIAESNPNNLFVVRQLGKFSMQTGQWEKAENRLRKAIQIAPEDAYSYLLLAQTLQKRGKISEAKLIAAKGIQLAQKSNSNTLLQKQFEELIHTL